MGFKTIIFILTFCFCMNSLANKRKGIPLQSQKKTPQSQRKSVSSKKHKKPFPVFNGNNSRASGIIITFKDWPVDRERIKPLVKKLRSNHLKVKSKLPLFKSWVFKWNQPQKAIKGDVLCLELMINKRISSLFQSCRTDYLNQPSRYRVANLAGGDYKRPGELISPGFQFQVNHLNTCKNNKGENLVISKIYYKDGKKRPDYWAQEFIGADLLKEEVKNAPKLRENLFHLLDNDDDTFPAYHATKMSNLISGPGKQAVLPKITNRKNFFEVDFYSGYMEYAQNLCHNKAAENSHHPCVPPPSFINNSMTWGDDRFLLNCLADHVTPEMKVMIDSVVSEYKNFCERCRSGDIHISQRHLCKENHEVCDFLLILNKKNYKKAKDKACDKAKEYQSIYQAMEHISSLSTITVTGAGNFHSDDPENGDYVDYCGYPSGHPKACHNQDDLGKSKVKASRELNVILVGSMRPDGKRSLFSQEGEEVDIMAPADSFLLSVGKDGKLERSGGTSGATALVTASLAGFGIMSGGYHPSIEEVRRLLKKTAIPHLYMNDRPRKNGVGVVNAYKLGMVGKRLRERCKGNETCIKDQIRGNDVFQFPEDKGLSEALMKTFPECYVCSPSSSTGNASASCRTKAEVFKRLRKASLLNPSDKKLWKALACIYEGSGFYEMADNMMNTYKSLSGKRPGEFQRCRSHTDCILVPTKLFCKPTFSSSALLHKFVCGKDSKSDMCDRDLRGDPSTAAFFPMNKTLFETSEHLSWRHGQCCTWNRACMRQWCRTNSREVLEEILPEEDKGRRKPKRLYYQSQCRTKCVMRHWDSEKAPETIPMESEEPEVYEIHQ